jgi:CRP-like cAMP-binding protein
MMVKDIHDLIHQLELIRTEVSFAGADLELDGFDFGRFEALLDCVPKLESQLTEALARRIDDVINTVLPIFEAHYLQVASEVGGIRKTRKALKGYMGVSYHTRARHVFRNI